MTKQQQTRMRFLKRQMLAYEKLRKELQSIEAAEQLAKDQKLVGKCFKYSNSYGSGERWWLYAKVLRIEPDELGHDVIVWKFEKTSDGKHQVDLNERYGLFGGSWLPITEDEFGIAWHDFIAELNEFGEAIETLNDGTE
jgi:hypothetical protein